MAPIGVIVSPTPREFWIGLGRAFAGALIFAVPVLMTMEAWALGFHLHPLRLALFLAVTVPMLVLLHKYGGFRQTMMLRDRIADAFVALLIATVAAAAVLLIFGIVNGEMPLREVVGKIAVQVVPGSLGASLARAQLGPSPSEDDEIPEPGYPGELFLMVVGALFLSVNIAPTEEVVLIAYKMYPWQEIALVVGTIGLMHAFGHTGSGAVHHSMGYAELLKVRSMAGMYPAPDGPGFPYTTHAALPFTEFDHIYTLTA